MVSRILLGKIFMILSLVPSGFLIYTLTSLEEWKDYGRGLTPYENWMFLYGDLTSHIFVTSCRFGG